MKNIFLIGLLAFSTLVFGQSHSQEVLDWQSKMNTEFANPKSSPLKKKDLKKFEALDFFKPDSTYRVIASLKLTPEARPFKMRTTTDRLADYRQYGIATFNLNDSVFSIPVYQNLRLLKAPGFEKYLFIPFKDLTNGNETYGGGRYVESKITDGDSLVIDFNKAYNPYCAYNSRYSCPIPPPENYINTYIIAGVKADGKH